MNIRLHFLISYISGFVTSYIIGFRTASGAALLFGMSFYLYITFFMKKSTLEDQFLNPEEDDQVES